MARMQTEPILFPILFRFGRNVVPTSREMVKIWRMKHVGPNQFSIPEGRKPEHVLRWLIDFNGRLREARIVGSRLTFLRPLGWLWSFTRNIYEISPGRTATVQELLSISGGASRDPEKSNARGFRGFLSKLPDDSEFTQSMFFDFMRERPDRPEGSFP